MASKKKPKQPRRRPVLLSPVERSRFVKEYGEARSWGGKKAVCEKYNIDTGQATHLVEEHLLGPRKVNWAKYTPTQQAQIMQEYINAPEGSKRDVAFSYGLMTRSISSAVDRWRKKGEAPEPQDAPLQPIQSPPSNRDYLRVRQGLPPTEKVSFAQGEPEIRSRRSKHTMDNYIPSPPQPEPSQDPRDEIWNLYKNGQISKEAFDLLVSKFKG